jgi:hypothetical protein
MAKKMKEMEADATPGLETNVFAMMSEKTPMTNIKVEKLKSTKSCLPLAPI